MPTRTRNGRGLCPSTASETTSLFEIEQVVKRRGYDYSLGPLDASLDPGQILGIMGPNGAGKTTLLRLLWGFLRPDSGSVTVFGRTAHMEQVWVRRHAGYLAESPHFYEWMSAHRFLSFVAGFYPTWNWDYAREMMRQLDLDMDTLVGNLSKGSRAKLGLAAAVAHRPRLLILDEPTAGLDPLVRREVLGTLHRLAQEEGTGIVLSSHVSDDLDRIAGSVLMLSDGKPIEYAPTGTLLERYKSNQLEEVFLSAIGRVRTVGPAHRA
jgi:ABC-2 type transport system ATP-binding protein